MCCLFILNENASFYIAIRATIASILRATREREREQVERDRGIGKEDAIVLCALYRQLQKFYGRNTGVFTDVHPHVKTIRKYCYFFAR